MAHTVASRNRAALEYYHILYSLLLSRDADACCANGRAAGQARVLPFRLRLPEGRDLTA